MRNVSVMALFALAAPSVSAQVTGSISGVVEDNSGAVTATASVTVTNAETGLSRTLESDERGHFTVLSLPVGRYDVKVEKSGFKTAVNTGVDLVVAQEHYFVRAQHPSVDLKPRLGVTPEAQRAELH